MTNDNNLWVSLGEAQVTPGHITALAFDPHYDMLWAADTVSYVYGCIPSMDSQETSSSHQLHWNSYCIVLPFRSMMELQDFRLCPFARDFIAVVSDRQVALIEHGGATKHKLDYPSTLSTAAGTRLFLYCNSRGLYSFSTNEPAQLTFHAGESGANPQPEDPDTALPYLSPASSAMDVGQLGYNSGMLSPIPQDQGLMPRINSTPGLEHCPTQYKLSDTNWSRQHVAKPPLVPSQLTALSSSPDGKIVATASRIGDLSLRDATVEGAPIIQTLRSTSHQRIDRLCIRDHSLVALSSAGSSSSIIQLFDTRKFTEPVSTFIFPSVVMDAVLTSERDFLVLTSHNLCHVDLMVPTWSALLNFQNDGSTSTYTRLAVSPSGQSLVLSGLLAEQAGSSFASFTLNPSTFTVQEKPCAPPYPQHPFLPSSSNKPLHELTALGYVHSHADDAKRSSNWPPPHHIIRAQPARPLVVPSHLQEFVGHLLYAHDVHLTRAMIFAENPKDKLRSFLPNPYPYNDDLGCDLSRVAPVLVQLLKLRAASSRRTKGSNYRNLFSTSLEDALQFCYNQASPISWVSAGLNPGNGFIGLDNSLPECWINPLLQCLYHIGAPHHALRLAFTRHFLCSRHAVSMEIGSLFANMQLQSKLGLSQPISQVSNILRVLREHPMMRANKIFRNVDSRDDAVERMHQFIRSFLSLIEAEFSEGSSKSFIDAPVTNRNFNLADVFGTQLRLSVSHKSIQPRFYWEVPSSASKIDEGLQHLLKQLEHQRGEVATIRQLPNVLVLLLNPDHGSSLRPPKVLKFSRQSESYNYNISSNIVHIAEDANDPGVFVAHVRTPTQTLQQTGGMHDMWTVINDYAVSPPIATTEQIDATIPPSLTHSAVVSFYVLDAFKQLIPPADGLSRTTKQCDRILQEDQFTSLLRPTSRNARDAKGKQQRIIAQPIPGLPLNSIESGQIIAMDAEYIYPEWGNELRDGEPEWMRMQRKPFPMLARVSCILADPRDYRKDRLLMDDYIATTEPILDYATRYSGIYPGDLDPQTSTKPRLTTIGNVSLKLRCLRDLRVHVVGHGLQQDFRVLNLFVPRDRIIDTVEIFHLPSKRYMSLRFLAHHLLNHSVQSGNHDSIEDAQAALMIYRKYLELAETKTFKTVLDNLYEIGEETNWIVPEDSDLMLPKMISPPLDQPQRSRARTRRKGIRK